MKSFANVNARDLAQAVAASSRAHAERRSLPVLERAKFLAIFSDNLDEFFQVRVGSLKAQVEAGIASGPGEEPTGAKLDHPPRSRAPRAEERRLHRPAGSGSGSSRDPPVELGRAR